MNIDEADQAKADLISIEERLAEGEAIPAAVVANAHAYYQEAEIWRSEQEAEQRRADMKAQGIVPGPNQGIGLGS